MQQKNMRNAIGFVIVLWGLTIFFGQAMSELQNTATATFKAATSAVSVIDGRLNDL